MDNELKEFIKTLKKNDKIYKDINETATCQGIIIPILRKLNWDTDNIQEVIPEYSCGDGKVDYCLKSNNKKIFLEAKRVGSELIRHQKQLLQYAFEEGANLAVLTNGYNWWFYLPLIEGNWEERKFLTIEIEEQSIEKTLDNFNKYLRYKFVKKGTALENAKKLYRSKEKERKIDSTIPKAWGELLNKKDELLIEHISEEVESLCKLKPTKKKVIDYLESITKAASEPELESEYQNTSLDRSKKDNAKEKNATLFYLKSFARDGAEAKGIILEKKFKVLKNSIMTSTTVPSIQERIKEKRIKLIKNGIVKEREGDHIFVKDQIFSSPSLAASVIMGSSINGWERWETSNGVKLKKYKNNNDKNINTNTSKINNIKKQKKDYTGMPLKAFVFKNKEIQIHNWIDLLKNLCVKISELHKDDFEKITNLKGRKRRYFSYDKEKLFRASSKDINKTGIYYETNLSTNQIVKICEDILEMFDYKRDELKLITED